MQMVFRLPEPGDETLLEQYMEEHRKNGESEISASLGLGSCDYSCWLDTIRRNADRGDGDWGRSLLYLCFDGDALVGLLSIRYQLSAALSQKYGDIGYGVRPSMRRRGYATAMLRHGLEICRQKGMGSVTLGCFKSNIASAKIIERCGGVLTDENDSYKKGTLSRYYRIDL